MDWKRFMVAEIARETNLVTVAVGVCLFVSFRGDGRNRRCGFLRRWELEMGSIEHCYLLKNEMEEKDRLIVELEKLAVGLGAAKRLYGFNFVIDCKTASKVKFGYPGLACCPKWYWKMYVCPSICVNTVGRWLVSLSSVVLIIVLQSSTNVCASGLKHVTVVVAVPSLIIALKQYIFVNVMTLVRCLFMLVQGKSKVDLLQVLDVNYTPYAPGSGCITAPKGIAYPIDTSDCSGKLALESGTLLVYLPKINGNCRSRLINGMRGRKTFSDIRVPVMMHASMTLLRSFVTISRVPLQRPPDILKFRRSIIRAPTFSSSLCGGKPAKLNEFRYLAGYNSSVSPSSFPCGTASLKLR
nr:hypothetical protein [Tanacetum cinerariifolium]